MDFWTLYLKYTVIGNSNETILSICFLPTGEIDHTRTSSSDLIAATNLISPIITQLGPITDPWKFLNWFVVSFYWLFLLDVGQPFPTTYTTKPQDIVVLEIPNFLSPVTHTSSNNLLLNSTLRQIYATFMNDSIMPFLNLSHIAPFQPIEGQDVSMIPGQRTFIRSYDCVFRQLRQGFSAFIQVLIADYVLLAGGFKAYCIIAGMLQKRIATDGKDPFRNLSLWIGNYCQGCQMVKYGDLGNSDTIDKESGAAGMKT